jgi:hypothetical protein
VTSAIALAGSCSNEVTAPADLGTLSFVIVSGNGQSGVVGTELPQPLVIKATTPQGAAIADLTVNFRVTSGGGSVFAGSASTNNQGIAKDYWTLGTSIAVGQTVEVRAVLANGNKRVFGVFTATPLPGPATQFAINDGNNQTARVGTAVAIPPSVVVKDQYNNPAAGTTVTFVAASGGGSVTGGNTTADAIGIARVGSWTLGADMNTLTATASGLPSSPVTFTATGLYWLTQTAMPTARNRLGVAAINGILYAVGGNNSSGVPVATVEAYSPATETWTTKAPMPTERFDFGVTAINGILYAVGGFNNNGYLMTVEAYDPATDAWTTKAPMPSARSALGVTAINGILYAVGGFNNVPLGTVEAYDHATDTWTTRASMLSHRYFLGVAEINGILYAAGGADPSSLSGAVETYEPASNTWTEATESMLTARSLFGIVAMNDTLYAVGGYNSGPLATVEAFDPTTGIWTAKPSMSIARSGLGAAAINGIVYAVGGTGISSALVTVESYVP